MLGIDVSGLRADLKHNTDVLEQMLDTLKRLNENIVALNKTLVSQAKAKKPVEGTEKK